MYEYFHFCSFLYFVGARESQGGGFMLGLRMRVFNSTTVWLHDSKGKGGVSVDRNYFPFIGMHILIKRSLIFVSTVMCGQEGVSVVMLDIMVKS